MDISNVQAALKLGRVHYDIEVVGGHMPIANNDMFNGI